MFKLNNAVYLLGVLTYTINIMQEKNQKSIPICTSWLCQGLALGTITEYPFLV
jgi:hypothetical protein